MFPEQDEVLPKQDEVLPKQDEVLPEQDEFKPNDSATLVRQESELLDCSILSHEYTR